MSNDPVLIALQKQVGCYQRLAKLAQTQHEHVQNSRTEDLLAVLSQRQQVLDEVAELEKCIGPAKKQWGSYLASLNVEDRESAESMLAETRYLLEEITTADRNDSIALQQRKMNLGREINQTTMARKINQNYATAAYGKRPAALDIQQREQESAEMGIVAEAFSDQGLPAQMTQASAAMRIEELGRIILAYSDVTEKLQQSHDQLQQTVQSLRNDLAEKNRQLERKHRLAALGEMAAGMAHEIRNPLGGIQLYASMLAKDLHEQPPALQLVNKISAGVKRLETLVSQVLHFTREIVARPAPFDLAALVDQSIELASDKMQSLGVQCRTQGPRPMIVTADSLLLGQALLNLLRNAAEAMDGPGAIELNWQGPQGNGHFHVTIRDSGPGIPSAVLERIFNPFFTTKETGTGLGLAIVHRIVEAHDGTISVCNSPEGGALFEIRI